MSLEEKTREWLFNRIRWTQWTQRRPMSPRLRPTMVKSMKEIAREEIEADTLNADPRYNRFVMEMEDAPIPLKHKQFFLGRLDRLLWDCVRRPAGDSDGALQWGCCHGMLALGICKF
jgi:hypothetical protein